MLDGIPTQANGLHRLWSSAPERLVSVLLQTGSESELSLYWTLCKVWSDQGHRVLVLDGSSAEQARAPGLAQVLAGKTSLHRCVLRASAQLHLLPSADGIRALCQQAQREDFDLVQEITDLTPGYDLAVLMAAAQPLAILLRGTDFVPLMSLGPDEQGVLRSYAALKQMVAQSGLRSALLAVNPPDDEPLAEQAWRGAQRVQDCARQFLDCAVEIQLVQRHHTVAGAPMNVYPLACRTLGQALPWTPHTTY